MFKKFSSEKKCNRITLTQNHLPEEMDINPACRFDKKKNLPGITLKTYLTNNFFLSNKRFFVSFIQRQPTTIRTMCVLLFTSLNL